MEFCVEEKINKKIIKRLIELDNDSYSNSDDSGILEKCLKWHEICPEIYTVIKQGKRIVGYINFVPITKQAYEKMRKGLLKDYELEFGDILPFKVGENYCLFMSIVIEEQFRDSEAIVELMNLFTQKFNGLKQKGIKVKKVLCDCVSKDGEKLISENFNPKFICFSKNGTKVYEFAL